MIMNATNEQKQLLKMYEIYFKLDITFEEAQSKIVKAEKAKEAVRNFWSKGNDLEGSGFFSRWLEDLPKTPKTIKKSK
jgi:hypothetical protein